MYGACQFCSAPPATIATGLGILGIVAATLFLLVFLMMVKSSKGAMKKARKQKQQEEKEKDPEKIKEADAHTAQVSNAGRNLQNSTRVTSGKNRTFGRSLSSKWLSFVCFVGVYN
jgi:type VI protein secretion system component VasK